MTLNMIDFKDGDEGEGISYPSIQLEEVTNGWLVTLLDSEEEEYQYVYDFKNKGDLLSLLKDILGAK